MKIWMLLTYLGLPLISVQSFACDCDLDYCYSGAKIIGPASSFPQNYNSDGTIYRSRLRDTLIAGSREEKCSIMNVHASVAGQDKNGAKNSATTGSDKQMELTNTSGYGGSYKTANVSTTEAVNQATQVANSAMQQMGTSMTNNAGQSAQNKISTTGTTASVAQGTADTLNEAAKAKTIAGTMQLGTSMTQLYRAYAHKQSLGTVEEQKREAKARNDALLTENLGKCVSQTLVVGTTAAQCKEAAQTLHDNREMNNISVNAINEQTAQGNEASKEAILAAGGAMAGMSALQQAAQERAQAKIALQQAAGSGFAFNPGNGAGYTDGGSAAPPTGDTGGVVAAATDTGALPSNTQLNPNLDTGGPNAPNGRLGEGGPAGGAPSSGGGGVASAAGTSAGKDDAANKDNTPQGKSSAGSYSDANGGPSGFSRAPGGPSVGMDNSFADMLKKFLPGEEGKAKNGDLNYNDRMPASDAAAVIARNKNIFEEVSKRYKKKSSDGEIVF